MKRGVWIHFAPLINFRADLTAVSLSHAVILRKIHKREHRWVLEQSHLGLPMLIDLGQVSHVVEKRPVNPSVTNPIADEPFERVVCALRLLRPGGVGFDFIGTSYARFEEGRAAKQTPSSGAWSGRKVLPRPDAEPFILERKNRQSLLRIYGQLNSRMSKRVTAALTRFNFAYEREQATDRLIDYWIALEGLFSPDDQRELAYRNGSSYRLLSPKQRDST